MNTQAKSQIEVCEQEHINDFSLVPKTAEEIANQLSLHPLILTLRRRLLELLSIYSADPELGPIEILLLRILAFEPVDTRSLCGLAALDMVSFSKSIKVLQNKFLVVATLTPTDKRRKMYRLTYEGVLAAQQAAMAAKRTEDAFLAPLPPRDQRLFIRLLTKLITKHAAKSTLEQDPRIAVILDGAIDPGTLVRRTLQLLVHFYNETCGDSEWSPLEASALSCLARYGSVQVKDLPKLISIDRGSAFAIRETLRKKQGLESVDINNRVLTLTPAFQVLGQRMYACLADCDRRMLGVLGKEERPRLMRVLRRLHVVWSVNAPDGK